MRNLLHCLDVLFFLRRNVFVESLKVNNLDIEHRQYIITEDIPHIGHQNITVSAVADPNSLEIANKATLLHGLTYSKGAISYNKVRLSD